MPRINSEPTDSIGGVPLGEYESAYYAMYAIVKFSEFCEKHDPARIAAAIKPKRDVETLRRDGATVAAWIEQLIATL